MDENKIQIPKMVSRLVWEALNPEQSLSSPLNAIDRAESLLAPHIDGAETGKYINAETGKPTKEKKDVEVIKKGNGEPEKNWYIGKKRFFESQISRKQREFKKRLMDKYDMSEMKAKKEARKMARNWFIHNRISLFIRLCKEANMYPLKTAQPSESVF